MIGNEIRYRVRHTTAYSYTGRVDLCHNLVHLYPREDDEQTVLSHFIEIDPNPDYQSERTDYFGNETLFVSIQRSHEKLVLTSNFTVIKKKKNPVITNVTWDNFPNVNAFVDESGVLLTDYLIASVACPLLPELKTYLGQSLVPQKNLLALADEVTSRIYNEFAYKPGSTQTNTPIQMALEKRNGVCQDFAHIMIAAFRTIGIPARYVSGYIETVAPEGQEKLTGADASHAWVEIYTPDAGWVAFDPTNNCRCGEQHIKLAHGRDYFDVQPLRGVFIGYGEQILRVAVDVVRVD